MRPIRTRADIAEGVSHLCRCEPRFGELARTLPPPPLRRARPGFETLLKSIVSQQLSVAAADTIWGRLVALQPPTPAAVCAANPDALRSAGLSKQKVAYAKGLAERVLDGRLQFRRVSRLADEDAIDALVSVPGIGRWTAEIYLMFGLGRADVIAAGDLALQLAAQDLFGMDKAGEAALRDRAKAWMPWRAVAARMLWQHYRSTRGREGIAGGR